MDQITIKGLRVRGRHGTTTQEITFGQEFEVDVILGCDLTKSCQSDQEEDTIDRREVVQTITHIIERGEHYNIADALAERIAQKILIEHPAVECVEVDLKQLQPPIAGDFDYLGVKIFRTR